MVGTWDAQDTTCTTFVLDSTDTAQCKRTVARPEDAERGGRLVFTADGAVSGTLRMAVTTSGEYERSCVEAKGMSLEEFCAQRHMVETPLPTDGLDESISVEGSTLGRECSVHQDVCTCKESVVYQYQFTSARYGAASDGSGLWLWKEGGINLGKFCVAGDYLATSTSEKTTTLLFKRAQ